jgi:hypothetical protein
MWIWSGVFLCRVNGPIISLCEKLGVYYIQGDFRFNNVMNQIGDMVNIWRKNLETRETQVSSQGFPLGADNRRIRPLPYSTSPATYLKKLCFFLKFFLSPSSVGCTYPINKMIKLKKKSHWTSWCSHFSNQFLIPGKVWGILQGVVWMPSYLSPATPTGSPATLTRAEN